MRVLMIGGARFAGRALSGLALDRDHDVTMFHRGPGPGDPWPEATHVHADRTDGFGTLAGRSFDLVVDMCGYVPREVVASCEAFADAGRYCYVSSVSAHRDDARVGATEDDDVHAPPFPETEEITDETYGPLKVACEREVTARFGERALVIRPGYIVGPFDPTDRFTYWARRAARGGEMLAPGPAGYAMQWIDARDLAAFMLDLGERGVGGTFSAITAPGRHSIRELLSTAREVADADTSFIWIDRPFAEEHGLLDDESDPLPMWTPQFAGGHLFDNTRALAAGLRTRSLQDTVRDTLAWDDARGAPWPLRAGLSSEREAALLGAWHAGRR